MKMDRFSIELATNIINLELQKETIIAQETLVNRLCYCRKNILTNYINICQLFFIRFTAKVIKFLEDKDISKTMTIDDLRHWYFAEMYDKMFKRDCNNRKMVLLFKLLQQKPDEHFFIFFQERFLHLLNTYEEYPNDQEFAQELHVFYTVISEWMEENILAIISLKINCENISNDILEDFKEFMTEGCSQPVELCAYPQGAPNCPSRSIFEEQQEDIHLYVSEDILSHAQWIMDYVGVLAKYHNNIKEVDLVIDYVLFEENNPLTYTIENVERVRVFKNIFRSLKIVNYEFVNFGKYFKEISQYLS